MGISYMALQLPSPSWKLQALIFFACVGLAGANPARPLLERVSFAERADGQGYVIRFHLTGTVAAYSEPEGTSEEGLKMILFNTGLANRYVHGEPDGPVVSYSEEVSSGHLVFRFKLDPKTRVTASAYRDRGTSDLLVGLTYTPEYQRGGTDVAKALPEPANGLSSEPVFSAEKPAAKNPASSEAKKWMLDTIVIDAGHGGHDPGAVANRVREKDITLGVARKLGEYIRDDLGADVVFTRDDDRFITLRNRGKIANAAGGKLFVSIHVNSAGNSSATGTETYFLGLHKSDAARKTMERENSVVKLENDPSEYEGLTEEELIRMSLTQSAYLRKSEALADLIEKQFEERVGRKSRGVKQAGFYVLWGASMPAVLVELGFLTNPSEAAFLSSESGQAYMASAIFRAVRDYKEEYERGLAQVSVE